MSQKTNYHLDRLETLRKDRNLTQAELARKLNISQRNYSHYETGDTNIPIDILCALARIFDVSIDYLLGLTDTADPYPRKKSKDGK